MRILPKCPFMAGWTAMDGGGPHGAARRSPVAPRIPGHRLCGGAVLPIRRATLPARAEEDIERFLVEGPVGRIVPCLRDEMAVRDLWRRRLGVIPTKRLATRPGVLRVVMLGGIGSVHFVLARIPGRCPLLPAVGGEASICNIRTKLLGCSLDDCIQ